MHLHTLNSDRLQRPALLVHLHRLNRIQRLPSLQYPPKDSVLPIQMRSRSIRDEELAAIRGCGYTFVCHAQNSPRVVSERSLNFVFKHTPIYRLVILDTTSSWRSSLDHEICNAPVEWRAIVGAACAESEEIVRCLWTGLAEQLQLDVTGRGVQRDRHAGL
jgi:hypothetical protein